MSSGLRWLLLGVLGLLIAGAVAFLAIRAVSEKIGISSESPAAGKALAPRPQGDAQVKPAGKRGDHSPAPAPSPASSTAPSTAPPQPTPAPSPAPAQSGGGDDYAGGGGGDFAGGGGNGEGGDD